MSKVLMVRANQGYPDSRVEKEIYSLSKRNKVELLGWNRTSRSKKIEEKEIDINGKLIKYHLFCIKAPQGAGIKKTFVPMIKFWFKVTKYLINHQSEYDVIHFCDFDTAAMAFSFINRKKIKVVYDIFDYYADSHQSPRIINALIRKRETQIIDKSNLVILCSEKRIQQIKPAKNKNIIVIHNSPSLKLHPTKFKLQGNINHTKKRLVYVGMLSDGRYLREISKVVIKHPEIEWHVGGFGKLSDYFSDLAREYKNIFYYGKLKYTQAIYLESQSDIMTAIYDPNIKNHKYAAPNKFYEALMLGKPVIMIKNTGMDNIVSDNNIGFVIDLDNSNFNRSFDKILNKISKIKDLDELKSRSFNIYQKNFSWDIMERRLLKAYSNLY